MIKAVIFDLDDTLLMSRQTKYEALKYTAQFFYKDHFTFTDDQIDEQWGKPFQQFIRDLFHGCDKTENIIRNYKSIIYKFPNKPYPGTLTILNTLQNIYKLGILTTTARDLVMNDLNVSRVGEIHFSHIQVEEDTLLHKPDPRVFKPTIIHFQKLGITTKQMIYIGDTVNDYLAASGAGLHFIGIPRIEKEKTEMLNKKLTIIESIKQLPKIFEKYD